MIPHYTHHLHVSEYSQSHIVRSSLRVSPDTAATDPVSRLKVELEDVLKISTPVLMVVSLMLLIVVCTMIMLCDYQYKKSKYSVWKAGLDMSSRCNSPGGDYRQCASMTDISTVSDYDYTPLLSQSVTAGSRTRVCPLPVGGSKSVPVTPVTANRRRRLLRRSETVEDYKIKLKKNKRKFSLPQKISKSKLYMSVSTIDRDMEQDEFVRESSDKISDIKTASSRLKKVSNKKRRTRRRHVAESTDSDLTRTGSEATLQPGGSVSGISSKASNSEFSSCVSLSGELEYDLYDCHIDNVMAAPGSMFAPAYWDTGDRTPSLELEMGDLFPADHVDSPSPVTLRHGRQDTCLVSSITSDLTASISSAVSNTTLVGDRDNTVMDNMDISCYHSAGEEDFSVKMDKQKIMNLTHIEDEIQYVDD